MSKRLVSVGGKYSPLEVSTDGQGHLRLSHPALPSDVVIDADTQVRYAAAIYDSRIELDAAENMKEALDEVDDDWLGDVDTLVTQCAVVSVWGYVTDAHGNEIRVEEDEVELRRDPPEPECIDDMQHRWSKPRPYGADQGHVNECQRCSRCGLIRTEGHVVGMPNGTLAEGIEYTPKEPD
jgi:hypothetical protein